MRQHRRILAQPPRSLVSYWAFDGNVKDAVGGNDGTVNGDPQFVPGVSGQELEFDGVDDYVTVPSTVFDSIESNNAFTISAWVTLADISSDSSVIGNFSDQFLVWADVSFGSYVAGITTASGFERAGGNSALVTGAENHVLTTWDGAQLKLYINNILESSINISESIVSSSNDIGIGSQNANGSRLMQGTIDEPRIYNRAISEDEIERLYNKDK